MRASNPIRKLFAWFAAKIEAGRWQSDFVCADCERWARCGLASSDDCIIRAREIESGEWKMRRRAQALRRTMIWPVLPVE